MKVLVFGGSGMLGHKLVQTLGRNFDVWTTLRGPYRAVEQYSIFDKKKTVEHVDVENAAIIETTIRELRPDVVVNAVGVIKQLPASSDVITTLEINSIFPHRLAQLAATFGYRMISISTDCVFDGAKGNYSENDPPDARDLYGKSKNLGEVAAENCLTIRTSIIGRELRTRHSLVEWFLSNRGKSVKGFVNAIYSGFPTVVFADIIRELIADWPSLTGLYHISSEPINKYDLLQLIRSKFSVDVEIDCFADFRIDRSLNSEKFRAETGFNPKPWDEMISIMATDPTPYDEWKR